MPEIRVASDHLRSFLKQAFMQTGMPELDAEFSSWATVQSDLWGIDSHGTLRFPDYEARLREGAVNPAPKMRNRLEKDLPVAHLDADAALGYVAGRDGMLLAIEKAKRFGLSLVVVANSNHFGAAGIYARMAAAEGLLGLATTNVRPNVSMEGAARSITGNNPVALAAPLPDGDPFCIDVSMSMVAQGKLILAAKKGESVPLGWAVDKQGVPTTDPQAGLAGMLLAIGGHKGFGLSLFIDVVTGLLGGSTFLSDITSMYSHPHLPSNLSHLFMALNPGLFMAPGDFEERMGKWRDMLKATPMLEGRPALIIPGEPEVETEKRRLETGIPIPEKLWSDLLAVAKRNGMDMPLQIQNGSGEKR